MCVPPSLSHANHGTPPPHRSSVAMLSPTRYEEVREGLCAASEQQKMKKSRIRVR